jgi:hypothetical protein
MFRTAFRDWHNDLHALNGGADLIVGRFTASDPGVSTSADKKVAAA